MQISKKHKFIVFVTLVTGVIGIAGCIIFGSSKDLSKPAPQVIDYTRFDSERWKKNANYDRERCVSDLIDRQLLMGLSEQQVINLLGTPDWKKPDYLGYEIRPETASYKTLFANLKNGEISKCELHSNP
jgi:hypothetical protein